MAKARARLSIFFGPYVELRREDGQDVRGMMGKEQGQDAAATVECDV